MLSGEVAIGVSISGRRVVFLQTTSQHVEQVATVLRLMKNAGLTLKLEKYFFITDAIEYVAHAIRSGTLKLATKITDVIRGFRPATNINKIR